MRFLQSTLGLKVLMALTGIVLVGFVIIHMLGNLQIFIPFEGISGTSSIDKYGHLLKSNALVLWGARLVLLGSVFGHIFAAVKLTVVGNGLYNMIYQKFYSVVGWGEMVPLVMDASDCLALFALLIPLYWIPE